MPETVRDSAPLLLGAPSVGLGEDGADRGAHYLLGRLGDQTEGVAHEMHSAPLPRGALQNGFDGTFEAPVGVAAHQPHPRETSSHQRAQKRCPESAVFARTDVQAQDLPLAGLRPHAYGDHHRHRDHLPVLSCFHVCGVNPHVWVGTLQRPTPEALDLLVELLAEPTDLALGDALHPEGPDEVVHLACGDAADVGFLDHSRKRPLGTSSGLQQRGEVARVPNPRHPQFHSPDPRVPVPLAVSVALPRASGRALVAGGAHVLLDLHLHKRLGKQPNALLEEGGVLLDHRLAQQLVESYPQLVGPRVWGPSYSVDWSLPIGTTRWPSSSTAAALTHSSGLYPVRRCSRGLVYYWCKLA